MNLVNQLRQWFGPPMFVDEEQQRVAQMLFTIQITLLIGAAVTLLISVLIGDWLTAYGLIAGGAAGLLSLVLGRQGHLRPASLLLLAALLMFLTYALYVGQGVHDVGILLYPVIIVIASLLLNRRSFAALMMLMIASFGIVVYGEQHHLVPGAFPEATDLSDFATGATILIIAAVVIRLISDDILRSLRRAQRNEHALVESHRQLQQQADARRIAEENYLSIVENAADGVFQSTPSGRFLSVNPAMARMYGYDSVSDMVNSITDIQQDLYVDPRERLELQRRLETEGTVSDFESCDRRKDGSTFWTSMNARIVRDAGGAAPFYEGILQDITQRKQAELARRKSEGILAAVAHIARQLLDAADWRQPIQAVLARLGEVTNATHVYVFENHLRADGELLSSQRYEWVMPGFRSEIDDPSLQNVPVHQPELDDWYGPLMRGEPFYSSSRGFSDHWSEALTRRGIKTLLDVPIFVNGQWWGIIGFDDCVNELAWSGIESDALCTAAEILGAAIQRQRADAERETLIAELEARNNELERFTYTVSHDLKSPLITVRGFLGFVEQDARAGRFDRLEVDLTRIVEATDKMRRLLDELLELSRIGRLMNPPEAVPFETIVQEAIRLVQGRIEARGVQVDIQPDLPVVQGDRARLVEVVQNLVDNACKFMGHQAAPRVTIGQRGHDPVGKPILFVQDNGIGIEAQHHERVFGLFNQLEAHGEGTGVGLALVKRIVEVHGGRIWVESEGAGKGATFRFTLPLKPE